jgi:hypothetical protein
MDLSIILQIVEQYGLFVALVIYVLYSNQRREERYIQIIEKLGKSFEQLKRDIHDIKSKIFEKDEE